MAYQLGIDFGTTYSAAAIHTNGQVEVQTLGNRSAAVPTVIFLRADETILVGDPANRRGVSDPSRVAREFKRRLGDPTPLMLGGTPYSAEALTAKLLRWMLDAVVERQGGPPDKIALSHPANWGPYKQDLLAQAVRLADLPPVVTLTEPQAAAISYASTERVEPGTVVAVYDLGGGTFDAAVLRKTDDGFTHLGMPEGIERLGGIDFDEAVYSHVLRATGDPIAALDPSDPSTLAAVARLRAEAVDAKEALSGDSDTSIPVLLPNVQTEVRLTRAEFESMIRPTLGDTIAALRRTLRSADLNPEDVDVVLLVGGSSRIPLVAQLVSAELDRPVAVDVHPKHAISTGAALAAARAVGIDTDALAESAAAAPASAAAPPPAAAAPVPVAPVPATPGLATPADAAAPAARETVEEPAAAEAPSTTAGRDAAPLDEPPSDRWTPGTREGAAPPADRGRNRTALLTGGIVVVLALVVASVLLVRSRSQEPLSQAQPQQSENAPASEAVPIDTTDVELTSVDVGPNGVTVDVPDGWPASDVDEETAGLGGKRRRGNATRYTDPDSGTHIETFWTNDPPGDDAQAFLHEASDAVAAEDDSYELVAISNYDHPGADAAATWEYTYSDGAEHGIILGWVVDGYAYSVGTESEQAQWETAQQLWQRSVDSVDSGDGITAEQEGIPGKDRSALISEIRLNSGRYEVYYDAFGYSPELPGGQHVHFFFDTVPPEEAGRPGSGPWFLYAGPVPFQEWTVDDRPDGAEQMCILVANPDHSVLQDTGNCVDLP